MNAVEIEEAVSALAAQPFDAAEFPYAFLAAFGNKDTALKRLRSGNSNSSDIPDGVLQRNNIHLAVCAQGRVGETLRALRESPKTAAGKVKFILATDGVTLESEDRTGSESVADDFPKFADHFGFFLPLAGISTVKEIKNNPVDIKATGRLNRLYIELIKNNPEWGTAERRADMNHFMARLIFCYFAEDTGIFRSNGLFTGTVEQMSKPDGTDTALVIGEIFRAMNTAVAERKAAKLPAWADGFPYVNGGLFSGSTDTPRFTRTARAYLTQAGALNWREINPDIFGSMIQAVADDTERGALGMHYTSVPNILKVLNPLFLDNLRAELASAGKSPAKLKKLRDRMAKIRVFDPACGSGNFLVIAYKQMRGIEAEINALLDDPKRKSGIPKTNFRGIELRDFPAEIARLALIIAEFQCDELYRDRALALAEFLPLDKQNWITCGNALRLDWLAICPPTGTGVKILSGDLFDTPLDQSEIDFENEGGETYICGNPPYLGGKKQDENQKIDMRDTANGRYNYKNLDYICAFFAKALDCIAHYERIAFVSTSSINQGIHVPNFWPFILSNNVKIDFCYEPFKWSNNASKNAGVYCTIIGLSKVSLSCAKYIYSDDGKREVKHINPYLVSGDDKIVQGRTSPIALLSQMNTGNQAADGGHLFLTSFEKAKIEELYPQSKQFIKPVIGTSEFFDSRIRWCLWIDDANVKIANNIEPIKSKIDQVYRFRANENAGEVAQTLKGNPHQFRYRNTTSRIGIIAPQVSSETREYIPAGIFGSNVIITHKAHAIFDATFVDFSVFNSRLQFVWARVLSGKLGNGMSYSSNLSWNTFPVPMMTDKDKEALTRCAEEILLARESHFPATIADLYDPEKMPENLRRAHDRNDEILEQIYIGRRFRNDTERLETLFSLYTKMTLESSLEKSVNKRKGKRTL